VKPISLAKALQKARNTKAREEERKEMLLKEEALPVLSLDAAVKAWPKFGETTKNPNKPVDYQWLLNPIEVQSDRQHP